MRYLLDTTLIVDHAHGYGPAMALLHRLYEDGAEGLEATVVTRNRPDFERQGAPVLTY